jgi:hypothetical protein
MVLPCHSARPRPRSRRTRDPPPSPPRCPRPHPTGLPGQIRAACSAHRAACGDPPSTPVRGIRGIDPRPGWRGCQRGARASSTGPSWPDTVHRGGVALTRIDPGGGPGVDHSMLMGMVYRRWSLRTGRGSVQRQSAERGDWDIETLDVRSRGRFFGRAVSATLCAMHADGDARLRLPLPTGAERPPGNRGALPHPGTGARRRRQSV